METKTVAGTFAQTAEFRAKYDSLLAACDEEGTLVVEDRLLENDKDIAPYLFVRKGTMDYIFPKQEARQEESRSKTISPGTGYELFQMYERYLVDASQVRGHLCIHYRDADNTPTLTVTDVRGGSEIPERVAQTLERILDGK